VSGDRQEVDAEHAHARRDLSDRLRRIGVEGHAALACDARAGLDGLDRPDLIVCVHDGHERSARRDRSPKIVWVDAPRTIDRENTDRDAEPLEKAARHEHGQVPYGPSRRGRLARATRGSIGVLAF
jgi:hypothetical protein